MLSAKQFVVFTINIFLLNSLLYAQVVTDGTIGPGRTLPGPNYTIGAELGNIQGSNWFHSFKDFNIGTGESATFSPEPVTNIIARVTGGNPSSIYGSLNANANLYLLNPSGILFGQGASVNVNGSFHASTADYIRLTDGTIFPAQLTPNPLLSIAPVEAFGFLSKSNPPAEIKIQGSVLKVSKGKDLSIIGGNLTIQDSTLQTQGGSVNLASVASTGEVVPTSSDWVLNFKQLGKITLQSSKSRISNPWITFEEAQSPNNFDVKAGQLFISAGELTLDKARLTAGTIDVSTQGDMVFTDSTLYAPGGLIKLTASGGNITLSQSEWLSFNELLPLPPGDPKQPVANLEVSNPPSGSAGQMIISAGKLFSTNKAWVFADTYGDKSGQIDVDVEGAISLTNSTKITAGNFGKAHEPGIIKVNTKGELFVGFKSDEELINSLAVPPETTITDLMQTEGFQEFLQILFASRIGTQTFNEGVGGNIEITTPTLEVSYGLIESATTGSGKAGDIQINASQVNLHDYGHVNASVGGSGEGNAGNILLCGIFCRTDENNRIGQVHLWNNSSISASTTEQSSGSAGNVVLKTQALDLENGGQINSFSDGKGNSSLINIEADTINIKTDTAFLQTDYNHQAGIYTKANQARGGNINLQVRDGLHILNSKISAEALGTASQDNGGNITINAFPFPKLKEFTLDNSELLANANQGHGGNIKVWLENFSLLGDSYKIDYSSQGGLYGEFWLNSVNISDVLPLSKEKDYLEIDSLLKNRCVSFSTENQSRFTITSRDILPRYPEDLRTHTIRLGNYY